MSFTNSIIDFVRGLMPFQGRYNALSDTDFRELNAQRLSRYQDNWACYYGLPLEVIRTEDKARSTRVNFLKRNLDKVNYFAFGKGHKLSHPRYQAHLDAATLAWGPKRIEKLLRCGQQGSVTGDAFVMVCPKEIANKINEANAKDASDTDTSLSAKIRVVVIPSEYCTPFYDPFDMDVLESVELRIPFQRRQTDGSYKSFVQYMRITDAEVEYGILDSDGRTWGSSLEVPDKQLKKIDNAIGYVYVRHIRNFPAGNSVFGFDDIAEAKVLNEAYTERLTNIGDIVAYHSAPITCIYGAKAQNLVRGPNKVWGNLPKDGKVETLELKGDLTAANEHLKKIKEGLHEITGVPEIAQGSQQAISNTSGVALHTMYLPLIERADTKQQIYGPEFVEVAILVLRWMQALKLNSYTMPTTGTVQTLDPISDDTAWEDIRQNAAISWDSPLPKDELIQVQVQSTRVTSGLQSVRGALVALGERDPDSKIKEIEEDKKKSMAMQQAQLESTMKAKAATTDLSNANGDGSLDSRGSPVNSGAGAGQGENTTDSGEQKGRPKTSGQ